MCNDIEVGDYVVFSGVVYDYYGIIILKLDDGVMFEIIEVINIIFGVVLGVLKFFGGKVEIKGFFKKFDFEVEKICVVVYRYCFLKKEIVWCVIGFYNNKEESGNYKYDLFDNNCEYFVIYCVIG